MVDNITSQERSRVMAAVKSKDTTPEKLLRSILHKKGLRFRLHNKKLPGSPDITLPRFKTVIFMHGCFWHGHHDSNCKLARTPKSNVQFWTEKVEANHARDKRSRRELMELGWRVLIVWECSLHTRRHELSDFADSIVDWLHGNIPFSETTAEGGLISIDSEKGAT
ncbi:DNA mismatch endonuclease Vsr [Pontiellaceae bacterium B12219]|nr:DNA mismatch endonuclease Vsr [Pontiellaceae bacterium B12219]